MGMTDHAQHELGNVVYVELPEPGSSFGIGDEVGAMESVKTVEPLYAPLSGRVLSVNPKLENDPETINTSPYDEGWMVEFEILEPSQEEGLMDAAAYTAFLAR
jgi:glycine cleavage system H protein